MVDEYQDTNYAQFKLVSLLAKKYRNLCVVGDDDQSIYKFRGAEKRLFYKFRCILKKHFQGKGHQAGAELPFHPEHFKRCQ